MYCIVFVWSTVNCVFVKLDYLVTLSSMIVAVQRCGERYTHAHTHTWRCTSNTRIQRKLLLIHINRIESLLFMFTFLSSPNCAIIFIFCCCCFSTFDNCILLWCLFVVFYLKRPQLFGQMLKLKFNRDNENKTTKIAMPTNNIDNRYWNRFLHMCTVFNWFEKMISSRFWEFFNHHVEIIFNENTFTYIHLLVSGFCVWLCFVFSLSLSLSSIWCQ